MKELLNIILYGPTGFVGSGVLTECLKHPQVNKVTAITRDKIPVQHEKLTEIILKDFEDYSQIKDKLSGHNAVFYCLGISSSQVRNHDKYYKITYDFTMAAAKAITEVNDDVTICFLSGAGTDETEKSRLHWARVKGKAENDLSNFNFKSVYNFRPAMIFPSHNEKSNYAGVKLLFPLYPLLNKIAKRYVTTTEEMGLAMINCALVGYEKNILENMDVRKASGLLK